MGHDAGHSPLSRREANDVAATVREWLSMVVMKWVQQIDAFFLVVLLVGDLAIENCSSGFGKLQRCVSQMCMGEC